LHARLALQVLLHTVGSKVSSHSFNAHLDMLYLRLRDGRDGHAQQQKQREFIDFHFFSFQNM
jgi:hypothetical protein